jgi:hypothetical protein
VEGRKFIQKFGRKTEGRDNSEDLGVGGKTITDWIVGKWGGKLWTGCICLRIGTSDGLL